MATAVVLLALAGLFGLVVAILTIRQRDETIDVLRRAHHDLLRERRGLISEARVRAGAILRVNAFGALEDITPARGKGGRFARKDAQ